PVHPPYRTTLAPASHPLARFSPNPVAPAAAPSTVGVSTVARLRPCPVLSRSLKTVAPVGSFILALAHPAAAAAAASSSEATASAAAARARIAAVNAPVTAEQRAEDERLKAMSWLERWRERKERRRRQEDRDPDLRPMERGSRAQLNVFGSNVREKKRR
ncbi:hypothetical protein JQN64_28355, partial [Escherichia coli]|nr:hypothetical protein [Escherichia coli]